MTEIKITKGFTFLDVILVILIASILAVVVILKFINFSQDAKNAVENGDAASVKVAIGNYYVESLLKNRTPLYPQTLDSASNGNASVSNPFFTNVLINGITGNGWSKVDNVTYEGQSGTRYTYNRNTGIFR